MRAGVLAVLVGVPVWAQISFERIQKADSEAGNWLTYHGNYSGHRYSGLDQINTGNVKGLRPAWVYQVGRSKVESTPLAVDEIMYLSEPPSNV